MKNINSLNTSDRLPLETEEQQALFEWAEMQKQSMPELSLMFAIPNGGKRYRKTACTLKAEGVKPGVSDIYLPVARCGFHGMFIEMKRKQGGKLSDEQRNFISAVAKQGYLAIVPEGWEEASKWILGYLKGEIKKIKK